MTEAPGPGQTVLLVGQPNAGKTTLFNALTGRHARTANYPGATVEYSIGTLRDQLGWRAQIVDLPGLLSLVPRSLDEEVTVRSLYGEAEHDPPDLAIVVADCSQLSRHLYLARQVLSTGLPAVIAITMSDLLERRGFTLDRAKLESRLGCPVVVVDGRSGAGVSELLARARGLAAPGGRSPVRPVTDIPGEQVKAAYREIESIERECLRLRMAPTSATPESGPLSGATSPHDLAHRVDPQTRRIDAVLLHPIFGLVLFAGLMAALFTGVFWIARPMMDAISGGCDSLAGWIVAFAPSSFLGQLLGDGIVRGAGGVLVFLPQIVILFLGMGLMEDSGYLARAAVLVDRPLAAVGLNGRSFVPLLSGFACAIPGMLAARTIPNRRERLLTIFIMPLMSCSARLPVYALLLAFLTPPDRPWLGGLALTAVYLLAIGAATAIAAIASRFLPRTGDSAFMLELPVYRRPQLGVIARSTYHRSKFYLIKAGVPILVISTLLWLFCHLPPVPAAEGATAVDAARQLEGSYAAAAGRLLEPIMQPLGLDWRVGVALIAAFAAREVFVGSLAIIFHATGEGDEATQASLLQMMREATVPGGEPLFTTATSIGLIVFFIFAMQCMSTAAVAYKEAGGWWMPLAQTVAFTGLAYVATWATVQGLRACGVA